MIENLSTMDKVIEKPKGLSRRTLVLVGAGLLVLLVVLLSLPMISRWSRAERSVPAATVRIGEVTRGTLVRDASAQGRIVASLHPTLFSPAPGIVTLEVKAGSEVRKGQSLARIESPELLSRLAQERSTFLTLQSSLARGRISARQSSIKNAQTVNLLELRLQAARRLLERADRVVSEGLMNKTDYEKAQDDVKIAELELKNARATAGLEADTASFEVREAQLQAERQSSAVAELQRQVDRLAIEAPFDGMVASVSVQDRDAVAANAPILTVVNLSQYEVEITLPENYGAEVLPGTRAEILYEGREYPGKVTAISPEVRDSQVTGTVVFEGTAPQGLKQSQRVSVRMVFENKPNVLKVPRGPFLESGGGRQVYVVAADGMATPRAIAVGAVSVSEVEVVSGLSVGEKVILSDTTEFAGAKSVLLTR
jgi:HlyD family secretion protein